MKLYKISGSNEYVDWDVLHNQQGYSLEATNSVTWMSAGDSTHEWGESVNTGYLEPIILRFTNSKGFCLGVYGWHTLNEMALEYGLWPDEAEEEEARSSTLGVSKVAVLEYTTSLRPPEIAKMYLVQKELEEGWMDEDTFAKRGWEIVPDVPLGELVFVDASGAVVYSVETLNEMAFAPTGYFTIDDADDVVFVEESPYPIVCQYSETHYGEVQDNAGVTLALPYYTQKLYLYEVVAVGGNVTSGWEIVNDNGFVKVVNKTGAAVTAVVFIIRLIDATDASIVDVEYISTGFRASAFKWSNSGTDYYFIPFYEEATGWTDDLSAIGWQEVPSVVLPTVTEITIYSNSSGHYFQSNVTNQTTLITSTYTYDLYLDQACTSPFVYDSSSLYLLGYLSSGTWKKSSVQTVADMPSSTTSDISSSISAQVLTSSGKLWLITNFTDTLHDGGYQWSKVCKVCSSNQAMVVTVYDSSNVAYNAFKFTTNNTVYYYVLDGTQTEWVNDLSSIGYSEVPVVILPTVSPLSSVSQSVGISSVTSISSNGKTEVLRAVSGSGYDGSYFPYESNKSYAAITYSDGTGWKNTVGIFEPSSTTYNGDSVCAKNVSSSTQNFYGIKIAVCSSNQAMVVTVYNSSNVAYNAFKFTANNTDYYYVLDGVQADWTDDLTGIGYHDEG